MRERLGSPALLGCTKNRASPPALPRGVLSYGACGLMIGLHRQPPLFCLFVSFDTLYIYVGFVAGYLGVVLLGPSKNKNKKKFRKIGSS